MYHLGQALSDTIGFVMTQRSTKSNRTRRDILMAAIDVWSADNTSSLGQVAQYAGVGRTTLNRYYPDRAHLVKAVDQECQTRFRSAVDRSRLSEGTGLQALIRLCTELIELGPVLALIFADNPLVSPDTWDSDQDDPFEEVIHRGYADGTITTDLVPEWITTIMWTSLAAAEQIISAGTRTRHETTEQLARTLTSGLGQVS